MVTQSYSPTTENIYDCLSTDTKPSDCPNGSKLNELDTQTVYRYDKANDVWYDVPDTPDGV